MKAKTEKNGSIIYINYYLNKSRPNEQDECPIYVRLKINDTSTSFSIKRSIHPDLWGKKTKLSAVLQT